MNIAFFGQAELGKYHTPIHIETVVELFETLGHPPKESQGIPCAIQALLYKRVVFYVRVKEEGFGTMDYLKGCKRLKAMPTIDAICLPGVGDATIIDATRSLCDLLITTEQDLFDYLTSST